MRVFSWSCILRYRRNRLTLKPPGPCSITSPIPPSLSNHVWRGRGGPGCCLAMQVCGLSHTCMCRSYTLLDEKSSAQRKKRTQGRGKKLTPYSSLYVVLGWKSRLWLAALLQSFAKSWACVWLVACSSLGLTFEFGALHMTAVCDQTHRSLCLLKPKQWRLQHISMSSLSFIKSPASVV